MRIGHVGLEAEVKSLYFIGFYWVTGNDEIFFKAGK